MYEINNRYLDDERVNLNIQLDQPILVIADLGLWNGRRTGYQEISSGNIRTAFTVAGILNTPHGMWIAGRPALRRHTPRRYEPSSLPHL